MKKPCDLFVSDEPLLEALQHCWEKDIWPSARNVAILLGYKQAKLTGRMNRRRKEILRGHFGM